MTKETPFPPPPALEAVAQTPSYTAGHKCSLEEGQNNLLMYNQLEECPDTGTKGRFLRNIDPHCFFSF